MKTKGKIYIIAQVAGVPEKELTQKFHNTEKMLSDRGFEVINPLKLVKKMPDSIRWHESFKNIIDALMECTHVYVLPCTEFCNVAQTELDLAMKANFNIYYELENIEVHEPVEELHSQE